MQKTIHALATNLTTFFAERNIKRAVVGLSGGVDSAVTLALGVKALGRTNVTAILMPEIGLSSPEHLKDAQNLVQSLGVPSYEVPLNPYLAELNGFPWGTSPLADMNIKARLRMMILYHFANSHDAMVLGTGNKTEVLMGYGTKYGDFGVDVEVIGSLYKTEVFALAKALGLPEIFYTKAPTAELAAGQTDEGEIGATYEQMDRILQNFEQQVSQTDDKALVEKVLKRVPLYKHKVEIVPTISRKKTHIADSI